MKQFLIGVLSFSVAVFFGATTLFVLVGPIALALSDKMGIVGVFVWYSILCGSIFYFSEP